MKKFAFFSKILFILSLFSVSALHAQGHLQIEHNSDSNPHILLNRPVVFFNQADLPVFDIIVEIFVHKLPGAVDANRLSQLVGVASIPVHAAVIIADRVVAHH